MPKIFGIVVIEDTGVLKCEQCGYRWEDKNSLDRILEGKRVTCPVCRAIQDRNIAKPLNTSGTVFVHPSIVNIKPSILLSDTYGVPLLCKKCGNEWVLTTQAWREKISKGIDCPKCIQSTQNRVKPGPKLRAIQPDKAMFIGNTKPKIEQASPVKIEPKEVKDDTKETPVIQEIKKDKREITEALVLENIGNTVNKHIVIKELDKDNQEILIQCAMCGVERKIPLRYLESKATRSSELLCISCQGDGSKAPLDSLRLKYLGKIYNGQKITDIYRGEKGQTLCTVQCMAATKFKVVDSRTVEIPGHVVKDIRLGDIINGHSYCKPCSNVPITSVERLFGVIMCEEFKRSVNKSVNFGYNGSSGDKLRCGEVYTTDGSLCGKCTRRERCSLDKEGPHLQFSYIREMADAKDKQTSAFKEVRAQYPNICSGTIAGASQYKAYPMKGFIVLRDAYRGHDKDKQLYKFCKCSEHGTEMVLSEREIAEFCHKQCQGEKNPNMRFYEIDDLYLLGKADRT